MNNQSHYRRLELQEAATYELGEREDGTYARDHLNIDITARRPLLDETSVLEGEAVGPIKLTIQHVDRQPNAADVAPLVLNTYLTDVDAIKLGQALIDLAHMHMVERIKVLEDRSALQAGAALCARGEVGELRFVRSTEDHWVGRSDCFNVQYMARKYHDEAPDTVLLEVTDIRLANLPAVQTNASSDQHWSQGSWHSTQDRDRFIRRLIGGTHQYTSGIKITMIGFSQTEAPPSAQ